MPHRRSILLSLLALAWLAAAPAIAQSAMELRPCAVPGVPGEARCGTLQVHESRDVPGGRTIGLNVLVLPARSAQRAPDAVTFLAGGPGQAATTIAPWIAASYDALRDTRDIVLLDQRGTGLSAPLNCVLRDAADLQSLAGDFLPVDAVRACRERLSATADLTRYTYPEFAHDLDAVRAALGYERLNLHGTSFGTRAAQVYMRMYPGRVRSAVLHSPVPMGFAMPARYADDFEAALAGTVRDCAADSACAAAFPRLADDVRALQARLRQGPVTATYLDAAVGPITITLSRGMAGEALRRLLYSSISAARFPAIVHRAATGDWGPIAREAVFDRRMTADGVGWGLFLSVTCAEDVPFADTTGAAASDAATTLGGYRLRQQAAACAEWPRAAIPAGYREPVRSDAPVLVIVGVLDPATPPPHARVAASAMPNAVHISIPSAGHGYQGMPGAQCMDALVVGFIQRAGPEGLDVSCPARIRRTPFHLALPQPVQLDRAVLERVAGFYTSAEPPREIAVEALPGGLRLRPGEGNPPIQLLPLSPTRFWPEGWPSGSELTVEERDGAVAALVLVVPGQPPVRFVPRR